MALAFLVLTVGAVSCSPGGDDQPAAARAATEAPAEPATAEAATHRVDIRDVLFGPEAMADPVGTTVTWTNQDAYAHSVVADDRSFRSEDLGQGASFPHTFHRPGTFSYLCAIHNHMTGLVVVP